MVTCPKRQVAPGIELGRRRPQGSGQGWRHPPNDARSRKRRDPLPQFLSHAQISDLKGCSARILTFCEACQQQQQQRQPQQPQKHQPCQGEIRVTLRIEPLAIKKVQPLSSCPAEYVLQPRHRQLLHIPRTCQHRKTDQNRSTQSQFQISTPACTCQHKHQSPLNQPVLSTT